jgi:hypothetical protein
MDLKNILISLLILNKIFLIIIFSMQSYVWGILISAFIIDILKNSVSFTSVAEKDDKLVEKNIEPISEGIKVKLEDQKELKVEYDRKPNIQNFNENLVIIIQYCTS